MTTIDTSSPPRAAQCFASDPAVRPAQPDGAFGIGIIVVFVVIAAGPDPYLMHSAVILAPPSALYWMGIDELGRDVMSRIIWGSRISLYVGLIAVGLGTTSGAVILWSWPISAASWPMPCSG